MHLELVGNFILKYFILFSLVAFAAATGIMPLDMPESVLVRFTGTMQPGITLRDLVHVWANYCIPYYHYSYMDRHVIYMYVLYVCMYVCM